MKTIKEYINESLSDDNILDSIDKDIEKYDIECLFSDNMYNRQRGINELYALIQKSGAKQYLNTRKIKWSDSYFLEAGESYIGQRSHKINYVVIVKRAGVNYQSVYITADGGEYSKKIKTYITSWESVTANLSPKTQQLYEVPEELNNLFKQIMIKSNSYL